MKFTALYLDHDAIGQEDLPTLQFGGFDARVRRIKDAIKAGKTCKKTDFEANSVAHAYETSKRLSLRDIAVGDIIIGENGRVWMYDHTGFTDVTKQLKSTLNP